MKKLLFSLSLLSFLTVSATDNPPVGARAQGMAGCGTALYGDLWGTQNNQAGLAFIKNFQAGAFYESRFLVSDLGMKAFGAAMPTKAGTFGLNVTSLGLGNLYSENKAGLGFAKSFGPKFAASAQIDYLYTHLAENYGNASTACGEIGLLAQPYRNLWLGFHIFNITRSKLSGNVDEHIPTIMRLGALYGFSDRVFVTVEAEKDIDFKPVIRGGFEYRPVNNFYIRAGAGTQPGLMAFGCGIVMKKVRLDLASTFHSVLGFSPSVSLQYGIE
ncbi:MAG TPA: hypothetical protein VFU15_16760 [Bacteroidia bacterium]|nr:hypothetical protein [Bacteroidia bacterium]